MVGSVPALGSSAVEGLHGCGEGGSHGGGCHVAGIFLGDGWLWSD